MKYSAAERPFSAPIRPEYIYVSAMSAMYVYLPQCRVPNNTHGYEYTKQGVDFPSFHRISDPLVTPCMTMVLQVSFSSIYFLLSKACCLHKKKILDILIKKTLKVINWTAPFYDSWCNAMVCRYYNGILA